MFINIFAAAFVVSVVMQLARAKVQKQQPIFLCFWVIVCSSSSLVLIYLAGIIIVIILARSYVGSRVEGSLKTKTFFNARAIQIIF